MVARTNSGDAYTFDAKDFQEAIAAVGPKASVLLLIAEPAEEDADLSDTEAIGLTARGLTSGNIGCIARALLFALQNDEQLMLGLMRYVALDLEQQEAAAQPDILAN